MAILEVTESEVVQRCATCGRNNRHLIDSLQVGIKPESGCADPTPIQLPQCSCGSAEFLLRSGERESEHPSPGCFGHLHRMLVDHVHSELVRREKVIPALRDERGRVPVGLAHPLSADARAKWFSGGLKIQPSPEETAAAYAVNPIPTPEAPEEAPQEDDKEEQDG